MGNKPYVATLAHFTVTTSLSFLLFLKAVLCRNISSQWAYPHGRLWNLKSHCRVKAGMVALPVALHTLWYCRGCTANTLYNIGLWPQQPLGRGSSLLQPSTLLQVNTEWSLAFSARSLPVQPRSLIPDCTLPRLSQPHRQFLKEAKLYGCWVSQFFMLFCGPRKPFVCLMRLRKGKANKHRTSCTGAVSKASFKPLHFFLQVCKSSDCHYWPG